MKIVRRIVVSLPRKSLLSIYKSFAGPHIDYRDVSYDNHV